MIHLKTAVWDFRYLKKGVCNLHLEAIDYLDQKA